MSSARSSFCTISIVALMITSLIIFLRSWHFDHPRKDFSSGSLRADLLSERSTLLQELTERRREISELHEIMDAAKVGETEWVKALRDESVVRVQDIDSAMINCERLLDMEVVDFLGSGYTKTVLKVTLPQGFSLALKSVNNQGTDMRKCLEDYKDPGGCNELVSFKLKKEVILLQSLQHPNIVKLRGHCQATAVVGGMSAVLEQGSPLQMIQLLQSPWEERFRVCLGLVRLLQYLSSSPLGSVALLDFQPRQFILVAGELKLTDLDDASVSEPACRSHDDCILPFPLLNFSVPCSSPEGGVCEGLNEMRNLYNAHRYFLTYLLPHQAPPMLTPLIHQIMNSTGKLKHSINETLMAFEEIFHLYKSGHHLDNVSSSLIREYAVLKGMRTEGNTEYRCWPSYSQQGCTLSVHNASEAALICNTHPQCTSFSLTSQRTWTGRTLATFRSGFSSLTPDGRSAVYVRRARTTRAGL